MNISHFQRHWEAFQSHFGYEKKIRKNPREYLT